MRKLAAHRCRDCKFFVDIKGKSEVRKGCLVNIRAYNTLREKVPDTVQVMDIIRRVGLEGLEQCLKNGNPEGRSCGRFLLK